MSNADREIDLLEQELLDAETEAERREIERAIRDVEREAAAEEAWLDEGYEQGWI